MIIRSILKHLKKSTCQHFAATIRRDRLILLGYYNETTSGQSKPCNT